MKKKNILNICMVLTIIAAVLCGLMAVASVKGKTPKGIEQAIAMSVTEKVGIAMIERSGIAYELKNGDAIVQGDQLYTKVAGFLTIAKEDTNLIYMGAESEIAIPKIAEQIQIDAKSGDVLIDGRTAEQLEVIAGEKTMKFKNAVASVSVQSGSIMLYVYAGDVTVADASGSENVIQSGKSAAILENEEELSVETLTAKRLSDDQINQLSKCEPDDSFCFSLEDLKKVQEERLAEMLEAQESANEILNAADKTDENGKSDNSSTNQSSNKENENSSNKNDVQDNTGGSIGSGSSSADQPSEETNKKHCTIKIVCDTILSNMDNLTPGKDAYVPSNGLILSTSTVSFTDGQTVFDVLQKVCSGAGIQLEYSYTPIYESYYIEGINYLYEFDCGSQSGWMYKVNGWFPNYGCSSYTIQDGDNIVWCYTCNGLGADVGA